MTVVTPTPTDATLLRGHHMIGAIAAGQRTTVLLGENESIALQLLEQEIRDLRRAVQEGNRERIRHCLEQMRKAFIYSAAIIAGSAGLIRCPACAELIDHEGLVVHKRQLCKGSARREAEDAAVG